MVMSQSQALVEELQQKVERLGSELPAQDDDANALQAAEALFASRLLGSSRLFFEPLVDLDRTMDARNGLLDTRCNPRPAFQVLRCLCAVLHSCGDTPFEGNTLFNGLEEYPEINADPRQLQEAYVEVFEEYLQEIERIASTGGFDYQRSLTSDPLDAAVVSLIAARAKLRRLRR